MQRSTFLGALVAISAAVPSQAGAASSKQIAGITIPDTSLAKDALSIARSVESTALLNHSIRTFLFAELIAKAKRIEHDAELVYVASLLHDTGLCPKYMSASYPFEVDGANVARTLLASHGVSDARTDTAWDAIALHDNGGIAQHKQPEVMLVNAGVGADFGGSLDILARADVVRVLEVAPRTHFIDVFLAAAAVVAKRKPFASAHSFVADVGYCKVPGFKLPSFCDEVKTDPFAGYIT
jgi:HD domain-containing protein